MSTPEEGLQAVAGNDDETSPVSVARDLVAQRESAFAALVTLAMQHPSYRNLAIADLDWLITPAVLTGNFMMMRRTIKDGTSIPVAAITWACVSAEVDERLMKNLHRPLRLSPAEYASGDICWLAHAFGPEAAIRELLRNLVWPGGKGDNGEERPPGPLAGRKLKVRAHRDDGGHEVRMIP